MSQAGIEGFCGEQDLLKIVQEVKELFGKVSQRSTKIKKQKAVAPNQSPASSSVREEAVKPETKEGGEEEIIMNQPKPVTAMKKRKKTASQTGRTASRTENEEKEGEKEKEGVSKT